MGSALRAANTLSGMCGASTRTRSVSSPPCLLVFCVAHADVAMSPSQRTSARTPAVARTSAVTTTSGSTCASTRASRCPRAAASDGGERSVCQRHFRFRYDLYVSLSSLRAPSPDFCLLSRALGRFIDEDGCPPYDGLRHGMNGHDPPVSMISSLSRFLLARSLFHFASLRSVACCCCCLCVSSFALWMCMRMCMCMMLRGLDSAPVSPAVHCVSYRLLYLYLYPYSSRPVCYHRARV